MAICINCFASKNLASVVTLPKLPFIRRTFGDFETDFSALVVFDNLDLFLADIGPAELDFSISSNAIHPEDFLSVNFCAGSEGFCISFTDLDLIDLNLILCNSFVYISN